MIAFPRFKEIDALATLKEKQREWLKDYEGCNFNISEFEKHRLKWATEPKEYSDKTFRTSINMVFPLKHRLMIELEPNKKDLSVQYQVIEFHLKSINAGYIRSTHKGKSDYLWVEFTRDLTEEEKKRFLNWITPKGSVVDYNFASEKKVFQVLYAKHWRHSENFELPLYYVEGSKIDFDSLNIPNQEIKTTTTKKNGFNYETSEEEPIKLEVIEFDYFKKLKKEKMGLVEQMVPSKSLIMNYGEPKKSKKTIFEFSKCIAISSGKPFLNHFRTKKSNCLYIDAENPDLQIKEIWTKLRKFYGIRKVKTGFYYLGRKTRIDLLNPNFRFELMDIIQKRKIKYIVIDTLPKCANYDTNQEREVNKIYKEFFKPIIEAFGCSITFILHTTKAGKSWIGSQSYLGIVDCSYEFKEVGDNRVKITSKNRGEDINFGIEYIFTDKEIQQNIFDVEKDSKPIPKAKFLELLNCVKGLFPDKITRLKRKEIEDRLQTKGIIIGSEKDGGHYSRATLTRVLSWLVDIQALDNQKGVYWLIR